MPWINKWLTNCIYFWNADSVKLLWNNMYCEKQYINKCELNWIEPEYLDLPEKHRLKHYMFNLYLFICFCLHKFTALQNHPNRSRMIDCFQIELLISLYSFHSTIFQINKISQYQGFFFPIACCPNEWLMQ